MKCSMKLYALLLLISNIHVIHTRIIIPGNAQTETETFSFAVAPTSFLARGNGALFVGAQDAGAEDFALAAFNSVTSSFVPFAPETVVLNGEQNTTNPLFNSEVHFVGLLEQKNITGDSFAGGVVATRNNVDPSVYLINMMRPSSLMSHVEIKDAAGSISDGIIALEGSSVGRAYVAVKPNGGVFGEPNSGVNVVFTMQVTVTDGDTERVETQLGSFTQAAKLDTTSPALRITSDLALLEAPVCMHWDKEINRLFVSVGNAVAGAGATDGVRSVVVGSNRGNSFSLQSLFDATTDFTDVGDNKIIVATGSDTQLSVHHCESMRTTTNKRYLIVVGGNGAPVDTQSSVFAIPLIVDANDNVFAANKDNITQPALSADHMITDTDIAAQVGGGNLPAGDIAQLFIRNETVFVSVQEGDTKKSGVYYSRPLFNADGTVKAWSAWQRATPQTDVLAASEELVSGTVFALASENTITRTQWGNGDEQSFKPVVDFVETHFPEEMGGVHTVCMFNDAIPGLDTLSLMAVLGSDRITLVQTGVRDDVLIPTSAADFANQALFTDGTVTAGPIMDQTILSIQGGALDTIGPLTSCAIARSDTQNNAWICIAGTHGVAILQNADGTGIDGVLGQNFSGIVDGMSFVQFGDYRLVQKLIADGEFLYVLTDTTIERIDLSNGIVDSTITVVAQVGAIAGLDTRDVFVDGIVSGNVVVLGTSGGLCATADITSEALQKIAVPEGEVPVMQLCAATQTGNDTDLATGTGGHLYVLAGNAHSNRTTINRFAVTSDGVIEPITTDNYLSQGNTVFINYGEFKDRYATDGAINFAVRNLHAGKETTIMAPGLAENATARSGNIFSGVRSREIVDIVSGDATVLALAQNSASGAWTVGGTMGLQVNE